MKIDEVYVYQIISVPVICFNHSVLVIPKSWLVFIYQETSNLHVAVWNCGFVPSKTVASDAKYVPSCSTRALQFLPVPGFFVQVKWWCSIPNKWTKYIQNITKWSKGKIHKIAKLLKQLHSGHGFCSSTTLPFSIAPLDHVRWRCPGCPGPDDCCHGSQRSHGKGWEVAVVDSGGLGLAKACGVGGVGRACLLRKEMDVGQNRRPRGPQMLV